MGDVPKVYLVLQHYSTSGTIIVSDIYEPSAMHIARADDGSMLVTFDMPQMPQKGYYSMNIMDLVTTDAGYGEFMISDGSLVSHTIPVEDDSDEVYADQNEGNHQLTADELKALAKIREEEKKNEQTLNQQNGNQEISSEVAPAETSNESPHMQKVQEIPGSTTASRDSQTPPKLSVEYAEVRSDSETKPVTISAKHLPAYKGGYDLTVFESDANGNVEGEAISYTRISPDSIVDGEFSVAIGMPGSLLKSGSVYAAFLMRSDPASNAAAANSGTVAQGPASDATSSNGNKGFTPVIHSEANTRSAVVNSTTTQVQSNTNADRQDSVNATVSVAAPTSEEGAQHGRVFWAIRGVGLTLVVGAVWTAHRRGILRS